MSAPVAKRSPDEREIALRCRCLELAVRNPAGDPVAQAARYFAFVTGTDDPTAKLEAIRGILG